MSLWYIKKTATHSPTFCLTWLKRPTLTPNHWVVIKQVNIVSLRARTHKIPTCCKNGRCFEKKNRLLFLFFFNFSFSLCVYWQKGRSIHTEQTTFLGIHTINAIIWTQTRFMQRNDSHIGKQRQLALGIDSFFAFQAHSRSACVHVYVRSPMNGWTRKTNVCIYQLGN